MISNRTFAFVLAAIFLLVGILTLPHYGINWDTINHLPRGQAFLHFFLTGDKDFSDLPSWRPYWQKADSLSVSSDIPKGDVPRRSLYQSDATPFDWFLEDDRVGHPPLSDILSSGFNLVLFQKLGLVNDIDSYRVYGIFLAASLVGLVFWWVARVYGKFAGLVASLSLSLYPLFWSESHFNTEKDVPETVFWGFLLFSVWWGITGRSWRWILLAGIFFGLALGTKFNVIFSFLVILPWLVVFAARQYIKNRLSLKDILEKNPKLGTALLVAPLLGIAIFIASWPYLWADPIARIGNVFQFYKGIGLTEGVDPRFLGPLGVNTYPLQWIVYTTPPFVLFLSFLGILASISKVKQEKEKTTLLFLLWLVVPVARVTWPGTTVYGGIRQIMEYIPALAIFAGLGGSVLLSWILRYLTWARWSKMFASFVILVAFVPILVKLIQIHPNENVYFNFLVGGLAGARERNLPSWGNSFGAAYRQGVNWINANAEEGANVVYAYELLPNVPRIFFRTDLNVHNSNRSGYLRNGEYAITMVYQGTSKRSYYDMYLEEFIKPIYQVTVDDVAILKVWKNDDAHLRRRWDERLTTDVFPEKKEFGLRFNLGGPQSLARLVIDYREADCKSLSSGYVQISKDGQNWERLPGLLPRSWRISFLGEQPKDGRFIEPFVGQEAKYIEIFLSPSDTCLRNFENFRLYSFEKESKF